MRPCLVFAAAFALVAAAGPARATPTVPSGRIGVINGRVSPAHESYRIRVAPIPTTPSTLEITLDLRYPGESAVPELDSFDVGPSAPFLLSARSDGDRAVGARVQGDALAGYRIELAPAGAGARVVRVRFEQEAPPPRRFGWRHALGELTWAEAAYVTSRSVVSAVVVPAGTSLPDRDCAREGDTFTCTSTAKSARRVPVLVRAPADRPGVLALVLAVCVSLAGFVRAFRGRAGELAEARRAVQVPSSEASGGAYRAPPVRTVIVNPDLAGAMRALSLRAAVIAVIAVGSTAAVAHLVSGSSPWPMPSLLAAWVAMAGFAAWVLVARR